MTSEEAICQFVAGRILEWQGLQPFAADYLPSCLDQLESQGWLQFNQGHLAYRIFRVSPGGHEVWLFTFDDNRVHLIEVFGSPLSFTVEALIEQLGGLPTRIGYPLTAQLQRPFRRFDEELEELVFVEKGLALLVGNASSSQARLVRIRGFEAMSVQRYKELFVDLPPVRFFPE